MHTRSREDRVPIQDFLRCSRGDSSGTWNATFGGPRFGPLVHSSVLSSRSAPRSRGRGFIGTASNKDIEFNDDVMSAVTMTLLLEGRLVSA